MRQIFYTLILVASCLGLTFALALPAQSAELKHGRYVGWIALEEAQEKIAVVADFFLESPEDLTQFPRLKAIFKLSLGGYNTHEYFSETYDDLKYDFENGVLTFDEPHNDLMMTAKVEAVGSDTVIAGQAFIRSSATFGRLYLKQESDEPGDDEDASEPDDLSVSFAPLLEGQYEGTCDGKRAAFQFQSVRGLKTIWQEETETSSLGRYYGIVGRLAYKDSPVCSNLGPAQWCTIFHYSGASYNFYLGKVNLSSGHSAEECSLRNGNLNCRIRAAGLTMDCDFKKKSSTIRPAVFSNRQYHVRATPEQMRELPAPQPPSNEALSSALKGVFLGYLHNETNNTYQVVRLNVLPFSSTENPHNPNQMMVTTSASVYLGKNLSGPFFTQRYEPRSLYLRPGFTLTGPKTDSYISIVEWKSGYIRGIWYSHAFGRVGTVQLVKGSLPTISDKAQIVSSFAGEYEGPMAPNGSVTPVRWFRYLFPTQPNDLIEHVVKFTGAYQMIDITPVQNIERGAYDPYTGVFGWIRSKGDASNLISGFIDSDQNAKIFWPPAPGVFGVLANEYGFETYKRRGGQ